MDAETVTRRLIIPEAASVATRDTSETGHSRRGRAASGRTSSVHASLHFGLDGLLQKRSRAVAQGLGQRVRKSSWLGELEDVSVGLGVSLLQWRSGGFEYPHDTPPYPLMPSPTFAHSSSLV